MTTWNELLPLAAKGDLIVAKAPDEDAWNKEFDDGYGLSEGPAVLAWSDEYVYFPVVYDGAEWLNRAPRSPRPEGQHHVGGE